MNEGRVYMCPYAHYSENKSLLCDGGKLVFPDKIGLNAYQNWLCKGDWEDCTIAVMLNEYHERTNK